MALEEQQLFLTANSNCNPLEEAELSLLSAKLADRWDRYIALATAPAQTQGTLLIFKTFILDMDVDTPSFRPSQYKMEFPSLKQKTVTITLIS